MSNGFIISRDWVPITEEQVQPGIRVKIIKEQGGGFGEIINFSPSGKRVIVKTLKSALTYDLSDILIREDNTASLLKEIMVGADPLMGGDQHANNPEMNRINQFRARIARDQLELSRLVAAYTKKQASQSQRPKPAPQRPGTLTPQQAQAMQQQSAQNALNAQSFPTMQQTQR